jgi:hypothetical protein
MISRWMVAAWSLWICVILALAFRPFLKNLEIFRTVDPALYLAILGALGASVLAATGYHFVRRWGFWRWEPTVLPIAILLLCAIYSPAGVVMILWITAAAFAVGRVATRVLSVEADIALSALAGFGVYSLVLFVLGVSHALYPWVFAILLIAPLAVFWRGIPLLAAEIRTMNQAWKSDPELSSLHVSIAMFAAIVLSIISATTLLTPAWNGDTVQFHIPLIRVFLAQHALTVPAAIPYGYFPQGFELLAALPYALAGQIAAQFLNPALFAIGLLLLYRIARACDISRAWALCGVILGLSIPFVHWTGSVTKNDFALGAYQLAALLCCLRFRETRTFRWLLLSAFFMAMSFDVKHVAIFGAIPWAIACAWMLWREPKMWARAAALAAVLLLGLIWEVRAYVGTGDPFSPATIERAAPKPGKGRGKGQGRAHGRWLLTAYRVNFRGQKNFQSPTRTPLGIVLLLLAPLWLIGLRGSFRKAEGLLWLYVILYYPSWAFEQGVLRYAIAPVLLLAILGVVRLALFPRWLAAAAMSAALLFALPAVVLVEMAPDEIPYFLKRIDSATFLRRTLPPYGAVEFLSRHATTEDSIASLGAWAAAYTPNPANFHLIYLNQRAYNAASVHRLLQPQDRYIILPRHPNLQELEAAVREDRKVKRVYQDREFVVDALEPASR